MRTGKDCYSRCIARRKYLGRGINCIISALEIGIVDGIKKSMHLSGVPTHVMDH
jgi:hypothetical protein